MKRLICGILVLAVMWQVVFVAYAGTAEVEMRLKPPANPWNAFSLEEKASFQEKVQKWLWLDGLGEKQNELLCGLFWGDASKGSRVDYAMLLYRLEVIRVSDPGNAIILLALGLVNEYFERNSRALTEYIYALACLEVYGHSNIVRDDVPKVLAMIHYRKGETKWALQMYEKAAASFLAVEASSDSPYPPIYTQYYLAACYRNMNTVESYALGRAQCIKILNDSSWFENENPHELEVYDLMVSLSCWFHSGTARQESDPLTSELIIKIQENPDDIYSKSERAFLLYYAGAYEIASKEFADSAEYIFSRIENIADSNIKEEQFRLGVSLLSYFAAADALLGRTDEAFETLERFLLESQSLSAFSQIYVLTSMAAIYTRSDDLETAKNVLTQIVENEVFMYSEDEAVQELYQNALHSREFY